MLADLPPSSRATRLSVCDAELGHALAGAGGAGERHHVDVGVGGDGLADRRAGAGDEVEHAGGQADVVDDLGEDEGVERRDLAGLEHDGAAGGHGVGDLGGDLVQRVVPRRDAADDADRLAHDEAVADRAPRTRSSRPARRPVLNELIGRPACTIRLSHFGMPASRVTIGGDLVHAGAEALGDAGAELGPLLGARGATSSANAARAALAAASTSAAVPSGMLADDLAVGGVEHVDRAGAGGRHPGAVDVDLVVSGHASPPRSSGRCRDATPRYLRA